MPKQTILVVGHGSRVPQAGAEFAQFVAALAQRFDSPLHACFLELAKPNMDAGFAAAVSDAGPGGEVLVLPLFLEAAGHVKNDVAAAVRRARAQFTGVRFRYGTALGPHANLVELLDVRARQALADPPAGDVLPPEETVALVVGRGSSDFAANSEIARAAYLLQAGRLWKSAEFAFQAVAQPTLPDGLHRCAALGARQIVVVPYILFTGKVDAFILNAARQAQTELGIPVRVARYLGTHKLVIDVAEQRVREMMTGSAGMT